MGFYFPSPLQLKRRGSRESLPLPRGTGSLRKNPKRNVPALLSPQIPSSCTEKLPLDGTNQKKKTHDPLRENNRGTVLSSGTFIPGLLRNSCALQPPGWAFSSSLHTPERFSAKARDVPGFGCHRVPSDGKERQGCVPKCQPYSASCISLRISPGQDALRFLCTMGWDGNFPMIAMG